MTDNINSLKRTVSSRLQAEAGNVAVELQAKDLVLYRDVVVQKKRAETQVFWDFWKDLWRVAEGLLAAGVVAGLALSIYGLLGLILG
jgi:hypothetical protein